MTKVGKAKPRNVVSVWFTESERIELRRLAHLDGYPTLNAWLKRLALRELEQES